ncbi:MAG: hypothetical protein KGR22_09445 [Planctomycetes bacterium]|nr:hypothetical protein [Planctomycetota bacterium]
MKTSALIASITVAGSLAFAASQQGNSQLQSMTTTDSVLAWSTNLRTSQSTLADECNVEFGEPLNWFGSVREVPAPQQCVLNFIGAGGYEDLNRDGRVDQLTFPETCVRQDWQNNAGAVIIGRQTTRLQDNPPKVRIQCLIRTAEIIVWIDENISVDHQNIKAAPRFLADLDDDGDLDFVVRLVFFGDDPAAIDDQRDVWIENVSTPPPTGDLNGDGSVTGADLAVVLANWTTSE